MAQGAVGEPAPWVDLARNSRADSRAFKRRIGMEHRQRILTAQQRELERVRARRKRARRRQGVVNCPVDVHIDTIELLIARGLLRRHQCDDRIEIGRALSKLTLTISVTRDATGS